MEDEANDVSVQAPTGWPASRRFNESTLVQDVVAGKADPAALDLWVVLVDLNNYRPSDMHQTLDDVPECAICSSMQRLKGSSYKHRVLRSSEQLTLHGSAPFGAPMGILIFERGKSRGESRLLLFTCTASMPEGEVPIISNGALNVHIDWDTGEFGIAKF